MEKFIFYFKLQHQLITFDQVENERMNEKECKYDDDWLFNEVLVIIVYISRQYDFPNSFSYYGCEY
jgi:hypothetical protein